MQRTPFNVEWGDPLASSIRHAIHLLGSRRWKGVGSRSTITLLLLAFTVGPASVVADEVAPSTNTAAPDHSGTSTTSPTLESMALPLGLQSYEPSAFGYTKNNDDVGFYNIKLSVKFPLAPVQTAKWFGDENRFYFSFSGYWGFYIGDRYSSPVVGKEYNPQLFWQHSFLCDPDRAFFTAAPVYGGSSSGKEPMTRESTPQPMSCYFAIGYNHDSNGQIIDSLDQYLAAQNAHGTEAANDSISRGWDYISISGKYQHSINANQFSLYPQFKYFLSDGLAQGPAEELHSWEHPSDGKPRKEVDGLGLIAKWRFQLGSPGNVFNDGKIAVRYGTGYQDPFTFSTVRVEAGIQVLQLPIVVWAERGYMSDLSQYYRNVTGYGVEFEIGAF